jgi:hypothetical protein
MRNYWGWRDDCHVARAMRSSLLLVSMLAFSGCQLVLGIEDRELAVCRGGTARCDDDGRRLVCEDDGSGERESPCEANEFCAGAGRCVERIACEADDARCGDDGRRLVCGSDGVEVETPCEAGLACAGDGVCACDPSSAKLARGPAGDHACAFACGELACWGKNEFGQLGIGTIGGSRSAPAHVALEAPPIAVAVGFAHTCAVLEGGQVWCWGGNGDGPVAGSIQADAIPTPRRVPALEPAIAIGAGFGTTCAILQEGSIRCVGRNSHGQLGDADTTSRREPFELTVPAEVTSPAVDVAVGTEHACSRHADGSLVCWGNEVWLGIGSATPGPRLPTRVPIEGVTALAIGDLHTCVVASGRVHCFGGSGDGQCGSFATEVLPAEVALQGADLAIDVGAGFRSSCASTAKSIQCWGANGFGQLGDGGCANPAAGCDGLKAATPRIVALDPQPVGSLGVHWTHACSSAESGLVCWGANGWGQSGSGSTDAVLGAPVAVSWPPIE